MYGYVHKSTPHTYVNLCKNHTDTRGHNHPKAPCLHLAREKFLVQRVSRGCDHIPTAKAKIVEPNHLHVKGNCCWVIRRNVNAHISMPAVLPGYACYFNVGRYDADPDINDMHFENFVAIIHLETQLKRIAACISKS